MKKFLLIVALICFLYANDFSIKSSTKERLSKDYVFKKYGCGGKNISPVISWQNPPKNTKSFAITIFDPDAPTGHGWWHWIVYNIPKDVNKIPLNASKSAILPKGSIEAKNDYGFTGFGGACPPKGDKAHRYIITIYALNIEKLPKILNPNKITQIIKKHTIRKVSITSLYKRD